MSEIVSKKSSQELKNKLIKFLVTSTLLGMWVRLRPRLGKGKASPKRKLVKKSKSAINWFNPKAKTRVDNNKVVLLQLNLGKNEFEEERR